MHEYAVVIGRFQPFHNAHLEMLKLATKDAEKVIIVVGSDNQARTVKNPWTTDERIEMIRDAVSNDHIIKAPGATGVSTVDEYVKRFTFVKAKDYLYNDNLWIAAVQEAINEATGGSRSIALYGHKKDSSSFYLKLFPQWEFIETGENQFPGTNVDASKVRDLMFQLDKIGVKHYVPAPVYSKLAAFMETKEFQRLHEEYHHIAAYRKSWEGAPFPPTFNTTDAIVVCSGHVLVVRRRGAPGRGLIALPGGFLHNSERIIDGCIRELKEETGIKVHPQELKKAVTSERVFDHPERSLRGRTITHAFCIKLPDGDLPQVKGMDDADKAWWMPLRDVFSREGEFFEDHFHIINYFITRF